jgi:hypothetical protein
MILCMYYIFTFKGSSLSHDFTSLIDLRQVPDFSVDFIVVLGGFYLFIF